MRQALCIAALVEQLTPEFPARLQRVEVALRDLRLESFVLFHRGAHRSNLQRKKRAPGLRSRVACFSANAASLPEALGTAATTGAISTPLLESGGGSLRRSTVVRQATSPGIGKMSSGTAKEKGLRFWNSWL